MRLVHAQYMWHPARAPVPCIRVCSTAPDAFRAFPGERASDTPSSLAASSRAPSSISPPCPLQPSRRLACTVCTSTRLHDLPCSGVRNQPESVRQGSAALHPTLAHATT